MIVVNQDRNGLVNIDTAGAIIVEGKKVIAKSGDSAYILGKYASEFRAEQMVRNIVDNIRKGSTVYEMAKSEN